MKIKGKTSQQIVLELTKIHNGEYEYLDIPDRISFKNKILIKCKIHGNFIQRLDHHSNGSGCPRCSGSFYKTQEEFIQEIKNKYGDTFKYDKVKYLGANKSVILTCPVHGDFERTPGRLLRSVCRCLKCLNRKIFNTNDFQREAKKKYPQYDYSLVEYRNAKSLLKIQCAKHGLFLKSSDSFMNGAGCPKCSVSISKPEEEWLNSLNIPNLERQKYIKIEDKRYKLDGYDPITNTVYEFYGDFYHGNPKFFACKKINAVNGKSFGELYKETKNKENKIKRAGFNFIYIWESEYLADIGKTLPQYQKHINEWGLIVADRMAYEKLWQYADGDDYDMGRMMDVFKT